MKKLAVLFVVVSFVVLSCKKETVVTNTPVVCNLDTNSIIGSWKVTSVILYGSLTIPPSTVSLNETSYEVFTDTTEYPICVTDDLHEFHPGGRYVYKDTGFSCSPSGTFGNGNWSLNNNHLVLNSDTFNVTSFECNRFITKSPTLVYDSIIAGTPGNPSTPIRIFYNLTTTYSKQ